MELLLLPFGSAITVVGYRPYSPPFRPKSALCIGGKRLLHDAADQRPGKRYLTDAKNHSSEAIVAASHLMALPYPLARACLSIPSCSTACANRASTSDSNRNHVWTHLYHFDRRYRFRLPGGRVNCCHIDLRQA